MLHIAAGIVVAAIVLYIVAGLFRAGGLFLPLALIIGFLLFACAI